MIFLKTEEEIEKIRVADQIVAHTLAEVGRHIKPGVTTLELDRIAEAYIRDCGARPNFLGYEGYPNSICASVNDVVMHGIPGKRELQEGDIVSVDCGAEIDGFHGDSCYTFAVGEISDKVAALLVTTKAALYSGIEQAVEGRRLGDIGAAVEETVTHAGYAVAREFTGHGIGMSMHEEPRVRNYGKRGSGMRLRRGMVIAIEPAVCMGSSRLVFDPDGWTVRTADGLPAAHFEHSVAVGADRAVILSSFDFIEKQ